MQWISEWFRIDQLTTIIEAGNCDADVVAFRSFLSLTQGASPAALSTFCYALLSKKSLDDMHNYDGCDFTALCLTSRNQQVLLLETLMHFGSDWMAKCVIKVFEILPLKPPAALYTRNVSLSTLFFQSICLSECSIAGLPVLTNR